MKARIRKRQMQSVLPVHPAYHHPRRQPVGYLLKQLEHRHQGQEQRRYGSPPRRLIQGGELVLIRQELVEVLADLEVDIARGQDYLPDPGRVWRNVPC
ncbi:MAG TPA: hypothetical protein VHS06_12075 [Chloroflexota bacterium]|nr:hypothetical protein [Chloroflexota bacterium]